MKKSLSLLLACLTVISCLSILGSCGSADPETVGEATSEELTAAPPANPPVSYADASYQIIRPDECDNAIVEAFKAVRTAIIDTYGTELHPGSDWVKPGSDIPENEILIGNTNRAETAVALSSLGGGQFTVCIVNRKLVIVGATDELTVMAAEYFINTLLPAGNSLAGDFRYVGGKEMKVSSFTLNGKNISEYTAVYQNVKFREAAEAFSGWLAENLGVSVPVVSAQAAPVENELVFGRCGREGEDGRERGYDDYACYARGSRLFFDGGSLWSAKAAVYSFLDTAVSQGKEIAVTASDGQYLLDRVMPAREEYIRDPSRMLLHWEGQWKPEAHMTDYQEKVDALTQQNTEHIFTVSHRGDFLFYPENSLESMISVWAMGGDCLEIDIHFTKDGIPVVMHDATLSRMTDYANFAGKNGFPSTANISDWTYAQLQSLHLKEGQGGNNAAVTPYVIPTLEEVLVCCKGRFFLILDKPAEWRYVDIEGIQPNSAARFIYPLMQKTGNFESVLISYGTLDNTAAGTLNATDALRIQKYIADNNGGAKTYFFLRCWTTRSTAQPYAELLNQKSLTNAGILVNGAFNPTNRSVMQEIKNLRKKYPRSLIGAWTIDDSGYDCPDVWETMYGIGIRSIMTNNMYGLVQYAATK